ncbi:unnamed protein product [Leptosia nina]|uniref:Peptidase S1 domain-containing protein n=1 Tax=Leptosia nina TaxID=320188 RepID=A0AAV1J4I4_9NEOP
MKVLDHLKNARAHSNISRSDKQDYNDESIIRENEFWEPSGRRIYKGERTKIKYFPFMASVHIFNNFHCAGSIIKSDLVITASSCLQLAWNNRLFRENPAFLSVRVGSSFYSGGGEVIPVLEIYFHPLYDPKSLRNNLCIVRLVRRLKFGKRVKRVKRIDIDRHPWSLPLTTPGITILGWGAKGRDVGGPGVVDGKLMGVISFGSPTCGTPDAPTVFTKLGFYTDWIEEIMEKKVPVTLKKTTEQPPFDVYSFLPKRRPTTTTFKIPPLTGKKLEPLSILDIDKALRLLDENLFKEFLSTMFTSGEIETYRNIIKHEKDVMRDDGIKSTTEKDIVTGGSLSVENEPKLVTRILNYSEEIKDITQSIELERSQTEEKNSKENSHDVNFEISKMEGRSQSIERLNDDHQPLKHIKNSNVESEIAQFMKNIDLKKIIEEEVMVTPNIKLDTKGKNESVVTFLYLSDNEKSKDVVVPEENGLSIATNDGFIDMTRSNSKNNYIVPENEMLGLVSEAIENELKNNNYKLSSTASTTFYSLHLFLDRKIVSESINTMANLLLRRAILDAVRVPAGTRSVSELAKIGNREWVGYGYNGQPNYVDRPDYPLPAVRFRVETPDVKALREKEKGDWHKLTVEEKKALYRASFCQTFAEFQAPTGQWKGALGWSLVMASLSLWIYMGVKLFVYSPLPDSFMGLRKQPLEVNGCYVEAYVSA